jgi:hypothetical protein
MYNLSVDYALKVKEKNAEILKEANISGSIFDGSFSWLTPQKV